MGTSKTVASGRFAVLARLAVALGFAATLLAGQAVFFDSAASAAPCRKPPEECLFDMETGG